MSDNIGKHVFETRRGGFAWFRGTVVGETAKTWRFARSYKVKERNDVLVPGDVEPKQAEAAFQEEFAKHRTSIKEAEGTVARLTQSACEAAVNAMISLSVSP